MFCLQLDFWGYTTFAALFIIAAACGWELILILGLPGKIAISRKHLVADAVTLISWDGFLAVVLWIQGLIWAFKSTDIEDRSSPCASHGLNMWLAPWTCCRFCSFRKDSLKARPISSSCAAPFWSTVSIFTLPWVAVSTPHRQMK